MGIPWPKIHIGKTKTIVELTTFDRRELLSRKNAVVAVPTGKGQIIQHVKVRWWAGVSLSGKYLHWIGIIRFDDA